MKPGLYRKRATAEESAAGSCRGELITSREAATRACGANIAFGPVINLVTDPRFGRFQEMFSPDPLLTASLVAAAFAPS